MNYLKMARQIVCKMAMPLALMFAACSDNGNSVVKGDDRSITPLGGSAEETGLNNISLVGRIKNYEEILEANNVDVESIKSIARMFELDSVTLDTVGKFFFGSYNDKTGEFRFDSISVNSPYALIEITSNKENEYWSKESWAFEDYDEYWGDFSVRAIVDLRKDSVIDINAMTYLESFRIVNLAQLGMSYTDAKNKADRDILDAFGFFKNSLDFAHLKNSNSSDSMAVAYITNYIVGHVDVVLPTVGKYGSFEKLSDSEKESWTWSLLRALEYAVIDSSYDTLKVRANSNFAAVLLGLGECTEEKEGSVYETSYTLYNLVCSSGNWGIAKNVPVIYTADTLVDSRDGKKYKTTTYDVGGLSQTWMAEDLTFNSPDGNYLYPDAIDMDSSIVMYSDDECMEYWLAEWAKGRNDSLTSTDSANVRSDCDQYRKDRSFINYERFWPAVDSVVAEKGVYQGICPDGWRLPTALEWESLMQKIADTYRNSDGEDAVLSASRYFELAGFGSVLRQDGDNPWLEGASYYAVAPDSSYRVSWCAECGANIAFVRFTYEYWDVLIRAINNDIGSVVRVRCIKDE